MEDQEYVKARKKLIPKAEEYAFQVAGPSPRGEGVPEIVIQNWADRWNFAFHSKMNDLAIRGGLVKAPAEDTHA